MRVYDVPVITKMKKVKIILKSLNKEGYSDIQGRDLKAQAKMHKCQAELYCNLTNMELR